MVAPGAFRWTLVQAPAVVSDVDTPLVGGVVDRRCVGWIGVVDPGKQGTCGYDLTCSNCRVKFDGVVDDAVDPVLSSMP